jgi:hypothetical protein
MLLRVFRSRPFWIIFLRSIINLYAPDVKGIFFIAKPGILVRPVRGPDHRSSCRLFTDTEPGGPCLLGGGPGCEDGGVQTRRKGEPGGMRPTGQVQGGHRPA